MATVIRSGEAEEDIIEIWYYIAVVRKSEWNADRFMQKMNEVFSYLAKNPNAGTLNHLYASGLYKYVYGNYLIFYFPIEDGIEVIRVLHGARDIETFFE